MLANYLKVALRTLARRRGYAFINIAGLSLGIAAAVLIGLYARYELTYDLFHDNADRIYVAYKERVTPTGTQATYDTWVPLLERMQATFPAVAGGTRDYTTTQWVEVNDRRFQEPVTYADPGLFDVFTLPLERGVAEDPLADPHAAVISREVAVKYFGEADPIGRVLTIDYETAYTVTGVFAEIPRNATFRPEIAVPITGAPWYADVADEWGSSFITTYVMLAEDASSTALEDQFPAFVADIWDEEVAGRTNFRLLPLPDAYDTFTDSRQYAYILLAVALATILIAGINFVNLATARSMDRAGEIGMRKVLGAARPHLMGQFLGESTLMGLVALVLGLLLALAALPAFNSLYELDLSLNVLRRPLLLPALVGLGLMVGLLAGLYPAAILSRFDPLRALQGKLGSTRGGLRLRHGLVVFQFALSIILIAGTFIMTDQIRYMKNRDLAFDKANMLVFPVEAGDFADAEDAAVRLETFKGELARRSDVEAVTSSSHVPGSWPGWFTFARPEGGDDESPLRVRQAYMDAAYFDAYGITIREGRSFMEGSESDRDESVILNAAALREFGWETGVGRIVRRGNTDYTVVGVVEDYHFQSLQEAVAPVLHFYRPPENGVHSFISVRLNADDYQAVLGSMQDLWRRLDPSRPFDYFFADENFDRLYRAQDRLVTVATAFAVLAVLIACLGLFGLATLTVAQRTKEIGVRKVLGASVAGVTLLLTKDFARLVLFAFVLAVPVAYIAMSNWLDAFAYRIEISWPIFLMAGLVALLVAVLTVSYHAVRAALADPVRSLRSL